MSTKLVILGILMEGNKHPYDMQQYIRHREMDKYIKFQKGSLYYTVEQLEKNGLIEVASVVTESNYPNKTVYRITEYGRKEFHDLLLKQIISTQNVINPINAAIAFIKHLDKNELIDVLKSKIHDGEVSLLELQTAYKKHELKIPKYALHIMASGIEFEKVELKMLKLILKDAENDRLNEYESVDGITLPEL